jgi:hypothetical protein
MSDFLLGVVAMSLVFIMWVMLFFIFDSEVLKGYFATKLRKRFNVEEIK